MSDLLFAISDSRVKKKLVEYEERFFAEYSKLILADDGL